MSKQNSENGRDSGTVQINRPLLRAATKLNTMLLASVFGGLGGLSLFVMTYVSLYRGLPDPGHYLNLLGIFLPGYSVSPSGAWIGLFWGSVIGAFLATLFYRIYARSIETQLQDYIANDKPEKDLLDITLRIDGNYLGLAVGAIVAGGLLVTSNWLVFRGTADESVHAALLSNYLPGYSVSFKGSLIGALELFVFTYLACLIFAWIYNRVAALRSGEYQ
ncbi:MAG: hypothetical protein BMS9Abin09_0163 [Gammaproteobacteria bacterium]|nr:MAG: hypothetical protein BMS9Abin09_0163 [Gammaproteobacteria bacterium]